MTTTRYTHEVGRFVIMIITFAFKCDFITESMQGTLLGKAKRGWVTSF
jgi:hypothetical protein